MKFKDPKTGALLEVRQAYNLFCERQGGHYPYCRFCPISSHKTGSGLHCLDYLNMHTAKAALLMGYEVIEDVPERSCFTCERYKNNNRPCGVPTLVTSPEKGCRGWEQKKKKEDNMEKNKPLSEWTLAESKEYCEEFRKSVADSGICEETPGCILHEKGICKAAKTWPHLWDLNRLTEPELAICKAIGAKWVSRNQIGMNALHLWDEKPSGDRNFYNGDATSLATVAETLFPSVHPGDLIEVP